MNLTKEDQELLTGKNGKTTAFAMGFLTKFGEAYGAEKFINIDYGHVYIEGLEQFVMPGETKDFLSLAIEEGVKVKFPSTMWNNGYEFDEKIHDKIFLSPEVREGIKKRQQALTALGIVNINTCTPYLNNDTAKPAFGSNIVSIESSAVSYFNTVMGLRSNRDGISAFFAAMTGRYPEFGMHIKENRKGDILFNVKADMKNSADYSALGHYIGEIMGVDVPVINGLSRPKTEEMQELCAALAVSGAVSLAHVVGVTPEAATIDEAFQGDKPAKTIDITDREIASVYDKFAKGSDNVHFICLGCPHLSIHDIQKYAQLFKNKKVHENTTVWLMSSLGNIFLAKESGYLNILEEAGVTVLSTCPVLSYGKPGPFYTYKDKDYSIGNFATNSIKLLTYSRNCCRPKKVFFGSTDRCIESAIAGRWV